MPKYDCQNPGCNGKINSMYELTISPNLLCDKCRYEKFGDRTSTWHALVKRDGLKCIVQGCPYKPKGVTGLGFHVHRIIPGKDGGRYTPENCVFVCRHHHKTVEGKTKQEILEMKCTDKQIERMDLFNTTDILTDYPADMVAVAIEHMCKMLGVPAKCDRYDMIAIIERELYDITN